ncbi:hypothetical protein QBC34DRAFT_432663 [Podospora aff. communis PSN243]|uniref:DUF6594 domain-containing protein n=1 Tax=Podospora aff. communis PSN243 TaxID=3040156 RepID=A0AAV9H3X8_9PEZI|nr:hypothetical protein QBC34DRAFT_432663 [Podospora aff. communis PSN243]
MPEGYARLASLMSAHPETAVLRRFGYLNRLNLLYLQAELVNLENALSEAARKDARSGHIERAVYARDWQSLSESLNATKDDADDPTQWKTMLEIREKLREYNQALHWQHQIAKIEPPSRQNFKFLQGWMKCPSMGNVYLLGADSDVWEKFDANEHICLHSGTGDESLISRFLANCVVPRYHRLVGQLFRTPDASELHRNTVEYSNQGIARLSAVVGTMMASLLLVGSIAVLSFLDRMQLRLAAIGVFSAVFSVMLGLLTNGRMVEIFSATAAFAAVQVVFVSNADLEMVYSQMMPPTCQC